MTDNRTRLAHEPALDGVRGIAVAGVLVFHGGHLTGGYLGVDAFFVLSGFLITSLLLAEARARGTISLGRFWARRARRLLPALALVLVAVAAYAAFVAKSDELNTIRGDALATMGYVANWRQIWTSNDYFAIFRNPSPLQHTWSLAIEEQFYVAWPLLVFAVVRRGRGGDIARRVLVMSVVLAGLSIAVAQYLYNAADPSRVYYGSDTRASSILIGAALAALLAWRGPVPRRWRDTLEVGAVASCVVLAVAWSRLDGSSATLYRGGFVLCAVAVAIVIAAGVDPRGGIVRRVLSVRPLGWLGLVSYGLYLWHWPVYVFLDADRVHLAGWPLLGVRVAVTIAISAVSYVFVERPIRYGAGSTTVMRRLTPALAAVLVVVVAVSTAGATSAPRDTAVDLRPGGVLLVGDSVAHALYPGLLDAGLHVRESWSPGCRLLAGEIKSKLKDPDCPWEFQWRTAVRDQRPDVVLLVIGAWDLFDLKPPGSKVFLVPGSPAWNNYARAQILKAVNILSARGARVVIPNLPCEGRIAAGPVLGDRSSFDVERVRAYNHLLSTVLAARAVPVPGPDLFSFLCPTGTFQRSGGAVGVVRGDGVHFTAAGADLVANWLYPQILAAAPHSDLLSQSRGTIRHSVLIYGDSFTFESRDVITLYLAAHRQWNAVVHAAPLAAVCDLQAELGPDLAGYHPTLVVLETSGASASPCMRTSAGRPIVPRTAAFYEKYRNDFRAFFATAVHGGAHVVVVTAPPSRTPATNAEQKRLLDLARTEAAPFGSSVSFDGGPGNALGGDTWTAAMPCIYLETLTKACRNGRIPVRGPEGVSLCAGELTTLADLAHGCRGYAGGATRYGRAISQVVLAQNPTPASRSGP